MGCPSAIVNQTFVKRFLPERGPDRPASTLQRHVGDRLWATIVGVIDDSPQKTLGQPPLPEIHFSLEQLQPQDDLYFLGTFYANVAIRTSLSTGTAGNELRRAVHELRPDIALQNVQSMQAVVENSLGNQVLAVRLLGLFALTGLVIAMAGIYGLLAYLVSQRTREMGVRLALGAQRDDILWLVLRRAIVLLGLGAAVGSVVTAASGRLLSSFLVYKLNGYDAVVALAVLVLLSVCGFTASYLPARRAAGIDPMVALRTE